MGKMSVPNVVHANITHTLANSHLQLTWEVDVPHGAILLEQVANFVVPASIKMHKK